MENLSITPMRGDNRGRATARSATPHTPCDGRKQRWTQRLRRLLPTIVLLLTMLAPYSMRAEEYYTSADNIAIGNRNATFEKWITTPLKWVGENTFSGTFTPTEHDINNWAQSGYGILFCVMANGDCLVNGQRAETTIQNPIPFKQKGDDNSCWYISQEYLNKPLKTTVVFTGPTTGTVTFEEAKDYHFSISDADSDTYDFTGEPVVLYGNEFANDKTLNWAVRWEGNDVTKGTQYYFPEDYTATVGEAKTLNLTTTEGTKFVTLPKGNYKYTLTADIETPSVTVAAEALQQSIKSVVFTLNGEPIVKGKEYELQGRESVGYQDLVMALDDDNAYYLTGGALTNGTATALGFVTEGEAWTATVPTVGENGGKYTFDWTIDNDGVKLTVNGTPIVAYHTDDFVVVVKNVTKDNGFDPAYGYSVMLPVADKLNTYAIKNFEYTDNKSVAYLAFGGAYASGNNSAETNAVWSSILCATGDEPVAIGDGVKDVEIKFVQGGKGFVGIPGELYDITLKYTSEDAAVVTITRNVAKEKKGWYVVTRTAKLDSEGNPTSEYNAWSEPLEMTMTLGENGATMEFYNNYQGDKTAGAAWPLHQDVMFYPAKQVYFYSVPMVETVAGSGEYKANGEPTYYTYAGSEALTVSDKGASITGKALTASAEAPTEGFTMANKDNASYVFIIEDGATPTLGVGREEYVDAPVYMVFNPKNSTPGDDSDVLVAQRTQVRLNAGDELRMFAQLGSSTTKFWRYRPAADIELPAVAGAADIQLFNAERGAKRPDGTTNEAATGKLTVAQSGLYTLAWYRDHNTRSVYLRVEAYKPTVSQIEMAGSFKFGETNFTNYYPLAYDAAKSRFVGDVFINNYEQLVVKAGQDITYGLENYTNINELKNEDGTSVDLKQYKENTAHFTIDLAKGKTGPMIIDGSHQGECGWYHVEFEEKFDANANSYFTLEMYNYDSMPATANVGEGYNQHCNLVIEREVKAENDDKTTTKIIREPMEIMGTWVGNFTSKPNDKVYVEYYTTSIFGSPTTVQNFKAVNETQFMNMPGYYTSISNVNSYVVGTNYFVMPATLTSGAKNDKGEIVGDEVVTSTDGLEWTFTFMYHGAHETQGNKKVKYYYSRRNAMDPDLTVVVMKNGTEVDRMDMDFEKLRNMAQAFVEVPGGATIKIIDNAATDEAKKTDENAVVYLTFGGDSHNVTNPYPETETISIQKEDIKRLYPGATFYPADAAGSDEFTAGWDADVTKNIRVVYSYYTQNFNPIPEIDLFFVEQYVAPRLFLVSTTQHSNGSNPSYDEFLFLTPKGKGVFNTEQKAWDDENGLTAEQLKAYGLEGTMNFTNASPDNAYPLCNMPDDPNYGRAFRHMVFDHLATTTVNVLDDEGNPKLDEQGYPITESVATTYFRKAKGDEVRLFGDEWNFRTGDHFFFAENLHVVDPRSLQGTITPGYYTCFEGATHDTRAIFAPGKNVRIYGTDVRRVRGLNADGSEIEAHYKQQHDWGIGGYGGGNFLESEDLKSVLLVDLRIPTDRYYHWGETNSYAGVPYYMESANSNIPASENSIATHQYFDYHPETGLYTLSVEKVCGALTIQADLGNGEVTDVYKFGGISGADAITDIGHPFQLWNHYNTDGEEYAPGQTPTDSQGFSIADPSAATAVSKSANTEMIYENVTFVFDPLTQRLWVYTAPREIPDKDFDIKEEKDDSDIDLYLLFVSPREIGGSEAGDPDANFADMYSGLKEYVEKNPYSENGVTLSVQDGAPVLNGTDDEIIWHLFNEARVDYIDRYFQVVGHHKMLPSASVYGRYYSGDFGALDAYGSTSGATNGWIDYCHTNITTETNTMQGEDWRDHAGKGTIAHPDNQFDLSMKAKDDGTATDKKYVPETYNVIYYFFSERPWKAGVKLSEYLSTSTCYGAYSGDGRFESARVKGETPEEPSQSSGSNHYNTGRRNLHPFTFDNGIANVEYTDEVRNYRYTSKHDGSTTSTNPEMRAANRADVAGYIPNFAFFGMKVMYNSRFYVVFDRSTERTEQSERIIDDEGNAQVVSRAKKEGAKLAVNDEPTGEAGISMFALKSYAHSRIYRYDDRMYVAFTDIDLAKNPNAPYSTTHPRYIRLEQVHYNDLGNGTRQLLMPGDEGYASAPVDPYNYVSVPFVGGAEEGEQIDNTYRMRSDDPVLGDKGFYAFPNNRYSGNIISDQIIQEECANNDAYDYQTNRDEYSYYFLTRKAVDSYGHPMTLRDMLMRSYNWMPAAPAVVDANAKQEQKEDAHRAVRRNKFSDPLLNTVAAYAEKLGDLSPDDESLANDEEFKKLKEAVGNYNELTAARSIFRTGYVNFFTEQFFNSFESDTEYNPENPATLTAGAKKVYLRTSKFDMDRFSPATANFDSSSELIIDEEYKPAADNRTIGETVHTSTVNHSMLDNYILATDPTFPLVYRVFVTLQGGARPYISSDATASDVSGVFYTDVYTSAESGTEPVARAMRPKYANGLNGGIQSDISAPTAQTEITIQGVYSADAAVKTGIQELVAPGADQASQFTAVVRVAPGHVSVTGVQNAASLYDVAGHTYVANARSIEADVPAGVYIVVADGAARKVMVP